jgi:hypothetical protein
MTILFVLFEFRTVHYDLHSNMYHLISFGWGIKLTQ